RAKHILRREAYLLAQLQSLEAWRGSVVDDVIQKSIIIPLNNNVRIKPEHILRDAQEMFNRQRNFALDGLSRKEGMLKSDHEWEYAAFYDVEYGTKPTDSDFDDAWQEVKNALMYLFNWDELMGLLSTSIYRIAQRKLVFQINKIKVAAVPDLILFFDDAPPVIIDWKVKRHTDYGFWLQLACYALALVRCKPHRDFKELVAGLRVSDINLWEAQLLAQQVHEYNLSHEDIEAVE